MEKIIFFALAVPILGFVFYLGGSAIMKGFKAKVDNRPNKTEETESDSETVIRSSNSNDLSSEISKLNDFVYEDYVPSNLQKVICLKASISARRRGLEYNLKPEDIVISETCPYLKIKLSYNKKDSKKPFYYSIDRIDSSKGYIKGNVRIISLLANTMKNEASSDQLLTFAKSILEIHKKS